MVTRPPVRGRAEVLWKHQDLKPGLFSLRTLLLFLFLLLHASSQALLSYSLSVIDYSCSCIYIHVYIYIHYIYIVAEMLSLQFVFNPTGLAVSMQRSLQHLQSSVWCSASSEQSSALTKMFSKKQDFPWHFPSCAACLTSLMTYLQFTRLPKGTIYLFE